MDNINLTASDKHEICNNLTKIRKCIKNPLSTCFQDCPWCENFDPVKTEKNIRA